MGLSYQSVNYIVLTSDLCVNQAWYEVLHFARSTHSSCVPAPPLQHTTIYSAQNKVTVQESRMLPLLVRRDWLLLLIKLYAARSFFWGKLWKFTTMKNSLIKSMNTTVRIYSMLFHVPFIWCLFSCCLHVQWSLHVRQISHIYDW